MPGQNPDYNEMLAIHKTMHLFDKIGGPNCTICSSHDIEIQEGIKNSLKLLEQKYKRFKKEEVRNHWIDKLKGIENEKRA